MLADMINIGLGFLEGLALILSPCILPILPIILSGSLEGNKKRPIGIIIGFVLSFALLTFFSRKWVQSTGIDLALIRHISFGLLFLFGLILLSETLSEKFNRFTQRLTSIGATVPVLNNPEGGLWSGIFFGCLVGVIWTPCAGPILAAVIVQTVIQQTSLTSFLIILAFGLGAAIPMFLIAFFGRKLFAHAGFLRTHAQLLRKILGAIILISVAYMWYAERQQYTFSPKATRYIAQKTIEKGVANPYPAPALKGIDAWFNSGPLELSQLKNRVVLIDFWTYSCINCIRSIPYLNDWHSKYYGKGLVIIGVHSPEFIFEKNIENVGRAVINNKIKYPVAIDNQFATWQAYQNRFWPAHYLINQRGEVVYIHYGEGNYDVTENNIRFLLGLKPTDKVTPEISVRNENETPETYLGTKRADQYSSPERIKEGVAVSYSYPTELAKNQWALQGNWAVGLDKITSASPDASIKIHFNAAKVYIVMGNQSGKPLSVKVTLNNKPLRPEEGKDVININQHTLYQVLTLVKPIDGMLELKASGVGLEMYTFTFGE